MRYSGYSALIGVFGPLPSKGADVTLPDVTLAADEKVAPPPIPSISSGLISGFQPMAAPIRNGGLPNGVLVLDASEYHDVAVCGVERTASTGEARLAAISGIVSRILACSRPT